MQHAPGETGQLLGPHALRGPFHVPPRCSQRSSRMTPHRPSVKQHAPRGCGHGFGVQVVSAPRNVPPRTAQRACRMIVHEPSAQQHAPRTRVWALAEGVIARQARMLTQMQMKTHRTWRMAGAPDRIRTKHQHTSAERPTRVCTHPRSLPCAAYRFLKLSRCDLGLWGPFGALVKHDSHTEAKRRDHLNLCCPKCSRSRLTIAKAGGCSLISFTNWLAEMLSRSEAVLASQPAEASTSSASASIAG